MAKQKAVQVVEKNPGEKIPWEQNGTKLIFGDDELMVNAAKYQRDWPVQLDVCADKSGNLVIGVGVGRYYVAQVDIPATAYTETELPAEEVPEGEAEAVSEGGMGGGNTPRTIREAQPIDMSAVVLTLWSVDDLPQAKQ